MLNETFILRVINIALCSNILFISSSLAQIQTINTSSEQPKKTEQTKKTGIGSLGDYTSSDKPKKIEQRRSIGSGSRSPCQSYLPKDSIILLIPEAKVVHKTSVSRPTLFLKSDVALNSELKFTLVNPQEAQPIVENTFSIRKPGIKKIELPNSIDLEQGTVYLWYIAISCSETNNDQYLEVLGSSVEFVPPSTKLQIELKSARNYKETAVIYSENGYWYEALAFSVKDNSDYLQIVLSKLNIIQK